MADAVETVDTAKPEAADGPERTPLDIALVGTVVPVETGVQAGLPAQGEAPETVAESDCRLKQAIPTFCCWSIGM